MQRKQYFRVISARIIRYQTHKYLHYTQLLMATGVCLYAHLWTAEKYFDLRKGWDTPSVL